MFTIKNRCISTSLIVLQETRILLPYNLQGSNMAQSKEDIELASLNAPPGILPPNTEFESYIGHNVINISNLDLNEHQLTALEKGLTFCPTPKGPDKSEIWNDFKEFHRRLELVQFFKPNEEQPNVDLGISQSIIDFMNANTTDDQVDEPTTSNFDHIHNQFKNKSTWKPYPPNRTLDTYKRSFKANLLESKIHPSRHSNLSREQWIGIQKLRENPDIVIKKADKGSAIVIMNTTDYLTVHSTHMKMSSDKAKTRSQ